MSQSSSAALPFAQPFPGFAHEAHEAIMPPRVAHLSPVLIRIHDVEMAYPNAKGKAVNVLTGINLAIRAGEFHVLLGPSGCGKSTLLNIIAGLAQPTGGSVTVNGERICKPGRDRGVVFQNADAAIFPWLNVRENVEFGPRMAARWKFRTAARSRKARRALAQQYIDLVGLGGHEEKFPHELSGGMKQRVQIARLLANNSTMLIMDEPFGALDAHTRRVMQNELVRTWRETEKTVLFVTHDIQEAILLGQYIHILSKAPAARIFETYHVELSYPRTETNPRYVELLAKIQRHFDFSGGA
jgi:NitT/TauT family transport system ATP-binding protein